MTPGQDSQIARNKVKRKYGLISPPLIIVIESLIPLLCPNLPYDVVGRVSIILYLSELIRM